MFEIDDDPSFPKLVSLQDACHKLAISRSTIYELIERQEFTRIKIGKKVCLLQSELADFVNRKVAEARQLTAA